MEKRNYIYKVECCTVIEILFVKSLMMWEQANTKL